MLNSLAPAEEFSGEAERPVAIFSQRELDCARVPQCPLTARRHRLAGQTSWNIARSTMGDAAPDPLERVASFAIGDLDRLEVHIAPVVEKLPQIRV